MIHDLELILYRNTKQLRLEDIPHKILIHGPNGAGKTNILEAVSYLIPGRGLRSAKYHDLCNLNHHITAPYWAIKAKCQDWAISMAYSSQNKQREVQINEAKVSALELGKLHNIVWVTPQMDRIFASNNTERRNFLDRLTYAHDKTHAINMKRYDNLLKERLVCLKQTYYDKNMVTIYEKQIAELASKIIQARQKLVGALQEQLINHHSALPEIHLTLESEVAKQNNQIEFIVEQLLKNRSLDQAMDKTSFKPHRAEFNALITQNKTPAKLGSTGQQKIILIALIMAHTQRLKESAPRVPIILLLDEIFVHLDSKFRSIVSGWIDSNARDNIQSWVTSTDLESFSSIDSDKTAIHDITQLVFP